MHPDALSIASRRHLAAMRKPLIRKKSLTRDLVSVEAVEPATVAVQADAGGGSAV